MINYTTHGNPDLFNLRFERQAFEERPTYEQALRLQQQEKEYKISMRKKLCSVPIIMKDDQGG